MKISKTYRLNGGTIELLDELNKIYGYTATRCIELAIYHMACDYLGDEEAQRKYLISSIKGEA